jgi:hypothetical protein
VRLFHLKWQVGAPLPHPLSKDDRGLRAVVVRDQDPDYGRGERFALVAFEGCLADAS